MNILAAPSDNVFWIFMAFLLIVLLVIFAVLFQFIGLYVRALVSGAKVGFVELIGMQLRKVNSTLIVNSRIQATRAGLHVSQAEMETHVLAGGDLLRVINAMIAAIKANIELSWQNATAIDLAGRDILDAVQTSVNPKVIDVPSQSMNQTTVDGQAKDGIELKVKARVTIRTNIKSLVGGATEETVVARVGQAIVNAIGSAEDYKHVLENPNRISQSALTMGLAANTAFEILSIDIAEIKVGENVGAKLAADRAESDKRRFQAEAEQRRAMAVAQEQENIAKQAENKALVVLAEAEIPKAMAEAFRSGNLGVMDYYKLRNMQADTSMREAIAKPGDSSKSSYPNAMTQFFNILAASEDDIPKFIIGGVFVFLWLISALMSQSAKKREQERRERLRRELERGTSAQPPLVIAPPPPMPSPMTARAKPQRQTRPAKPPRRIVTPPRIISRPVPIEQAARFSKASVITAPQRPAPKLPPAAVVPTSASAATLRAWMRPQTLRQQFIVTEIFQPPLGMRD